MRSFTSEVEGVARMVLYLYLESGKRTVSPTSIFLNSSVMPRVAILISLVSISVKFSLERWADSNRRSSCECSTTESYTVLDYIVGRSLRCRLLRGPFATGGHDSTRHPSFIGISTDGSFLSRHRPVSKCLSPLGLLDCFFIGYRSSLTVPAISCPGCISGIPNTSRYSSLFARMAGVEPAPTGSALRCHYATSSRSSR